MLARDAKREEGVPLEGGTTLQVFHFRRELPECLRESALPELEFYGLLDRANTGAAMYPNKTVARKSLRWVFVASVLLSTCACPRPAIPIHCSAASIHTHHPHQITATNHNHHSAPLTPHPSPLTPPQISQQ